MTQRIAVYPGSFDPVHVGHVDIIDRCCPIFDRVVVGILNNTAKDPLFSIEERVEMMEEVLQGRERCREKCTVESFTGLLVDFMKQIGASTIVRGLRAVSDFEAEFQMALMNRRLSPGIETVFLTPKEEYSYLSSRLVKEVHLLGGDLDGLVPSPVLEKMREQVARRA
jgi:pantetheine-phosphate adenylyltransferase